MLISGVSAGAETIINTTGIVIEKFQLVRSNKTEVAPGPSGEANAATAWLFANK